MHPLKQYLREVEEGFQDFAARVGVSRQTLYRIVSGGQAPRPLTARRIVEATGGAVTLDMLYGGKARGGAEVVKLNARADEPLLDPERLRLALAVVINHLRAEESAPLDAGMLAVGAEAAVHTYAALSPLTTRQGPARLAQALRPVLEEILKESGGVPAPSALDRGAELAAELYFQRRSLQRR
ncbi:helix-turn-helix transcriptional regulator [Hyphococcus sp.]|jgi:transcriptional regulator with XRE-family HTH domain|uniref:helix-turn-helix transcriptional regulator n=1 Tax=Hyphococcus sp. TaxID=2038636 RepID=UPI003D101181